MKPILRGHFHQAMFFIALGACLPMIFRSTTSPEILAVIVYSICTLTLFGVSSLYHRVTWDEKKRAVWKKLDHASIYLMIAGTMTPVAVLGLESKQSTTLLITIWSVALVGIIQSIFFVNLPKIVSAVIYIIAGYLITPYLIDLKSSIGVRNIWLIAAGGISYTMGALCYGLKWPKLKPAVFGYHEVFHLFVNLGALLHFIVINSLID